MSDEMKKRWQEKAASAKARDYDFQTLSGLDNEILYTPDDLEGSYEEKLGFPGEYPYTRGIHPNLYRGRLWTMRQFAGFGTPEQTNQRFKFLLREGQTGLSVAFDMPTLMGYDPDHAMSLGEVGKCGVSTSSIRDFETLFDGIPLDRVSTSMTINSTAIIALAFYIVTAERQGVSAEQLRGTLQNDILKEYIAQKEWIYPPEPSMRLITDMMKWCSDHMPLYNTISISGYHIREAGSTAAQELAFTLADGFTYVEYAVKAGMDVDEFAPRLSFFFNAHSDFFEEIAKYRAARRIWAKRMRTKYAAKKEKSWMLRFHTQTAGCSLTAQQPEVNIARVAFQALSAVLGGTQSLHTNSMDETLALPTEKAVEIALRTQQVLAYETGTASVVDPLGGSYYVEALTDRLEAEAEAYFSKLEELGGMIPAIEAGYPQREIAHASYQGHKKQENGQRITVGVNDFVKENETLDIPILEIDSTVETMQVEKIRQIRSERNTPAAENSLNELRRAAAEGSNVMEPLLQAVRNECTLGEIVDAFKDVFGTWEEKSEF